MPLEPPVFFAITAFMVDQQWRGLFRFFWPIRPHPGFAFFLIMLAAAGLCANEGEEFREWNNREGMQIEAKAISVDPEGASVLLEMRNGRVYRVRLDLLSDQDQEWIEANLGEAAPPSSSAAGDDDETPESLPLRFQVRGIREVVQKGAYCVPASAEMIARFHGVSVNQDTIAKLSSEDSLHHRGTLVSDMAQAMRNLGMEPTEVVWSSAEAFRARALDPLRRLLVNQGPVYVSFKPGVFGADGHGCVLLGYDHSRESLQFYNPWGQRFQLSYEEFGEQARGAVGFKTSGRDGLRDPGLSARIRDLFSEAPGDLEQLLRVLRQNEFKTDLRFGLRRDARGDRRLAERTGRDEGRDFIYYAFNRVPVIFITRQQSPSQPLEFVLVELSEHNRNLYRWQVLGSDGWSEAELSAATRLTRHWASEVHFARMEGWNLPLIDVWREDEG